MNTWKLYQEMCASLRADGLSTEGMYIAYLRGEIRRLKKELESKCQA